VHRFSHRFLRPDLVLLLVVFLALEAPPPHALWAALVLGLLRDLGSAGRLGASALVLLPATALLAAATRRLVRESPLVDAALTLAFVAGCGAALAVGTALLSPGADLGPLLARAGGQAAFTAALSPLAFAALAGARLVERSPGFETT
jgi:rod shape-determining protein MreD